MRLVGPSPITGVQWTNIPSGMYPTQDDAFDIGKADKNWRHFFMSGNFTVDTASWIGLGSGAARIEFDDQTVDEINFLDCNIGIGTSAPGAEGGTANIVQISGVTAPILNLTHTNAVTTQDLAIIQFSMGVSDSLAEIKSARASADDAANLQFHTQPTGGGLTERLRITSTGLLQVGAASGSGQVNITPQSAITALEMEEGTYDAPFFNFKATADGDTTSAISTLTTSGGTTHHIQVDINGAKAWIAVSTTNPSS